jgi:hypothetical protein
VLATDLASQSECLLIRGTVADPEQLNYLRNVVGLISWLLDNGGIAVYDPQMLKWCSRAEWRTAVLDLWSALPRHHVVILASEDENGTEWFHTRGMRKFGRPDLSIHRVRGDQCAAVIDLLNRFIEYQAFGGIIEEGEKIKMESLASGMRCTYRGHVGDPDFNNLHVEIMRPSDAEPGGAEDTP